MRSERMALPYVVNAFCTLAWSGYPAQMSPANKLPPDILQSMQGGQCVPDVFVRAKERDFPHLNFRQYKLVQTELWKLGFRRLSDLEVKNVSDDPDAVFRPTLIRCVVSQRRDIVATISQVRPGGKWIWRQSRQLLARLRWIEAMMMITSLWQSRFIVCFESELSDGSFIVTTNSGAATQVEWEHVIDHQCFTEGTKPGILFHAHVARSSRSRRAKALESVLINGEPNYLDMQARMKIAKHAFRKNIMD